MRWCFSSLPQKHRMYSLQLNSPASISAASQPSAKKPDDGAPAQLLTPRPSMSVIQTESMQENERSGNYVESFSSELRAFCTKVSKLFFTRFPTRSSALRKMYSIQRTHDPVLTSTFLIQVHYSSTKVKKCREMYWTLIKTPLSWVPWRRGSKVDSS